MLSSAATAAPRVGTPRRPFLPLSIRRRSVFKKAPKPRRRQLPCPPQALPAAAAVKAAASAAVAAPLTAAAASAAASQPSLAAVAAAALAETCVASALAALSWNLLLCAQIHEEDEDEDEAESDEEGEREDESKQRNNAPSSSSSSSSSEGNTNDTTTPFFAAAIHALGPPLSWACVIAAVTVAVRSVSTVAAAAAAASAAVATKSSTAATTAAALALALSGAASAAAETSLVVSSSGRASVVLLAAWGAVRAKDAAFARYVLLSSSSLTPMTKAGAATKAPAPPRRPRRSPLPRILVPLNSLATWATAAAAVAAALSAAGVDVRPLLAVGGVGGLAVAIGAQAVLANLAAVSFSFFQRLLRGSNYRQKLSTLTHSLPSIHFMSTTTTTKQGVSLFLSRPFVPGERVSLYLGGGHKFLSGVVERVDPARTTVRDDSALPHLLPNRVVAECVIMNESRAARTAAMIGRAAKVGVGAATRGNASSSSSPPSWRSAPRTVSLSFPLRLEDAHLGPAIVLSINKWLSASPLVDKRLPKGASLSAVVEGAAAGATSATTSPPSSLAANATITLSVSAYISAAAASSFTSFRQELLLAVVAAAKEAGSKGGGGRDGGNGSGSGKNNAVPFASSPPLSPPSSSHPTSSPFPPRENRPQDL